MGLMREKAMVIPVATKTQREAMHNRHARQGASVLWNLRPLTILLAET